MVPPVRPPGFVHVDLDGLWTLAGVYGYPERGEFEDDPVFTLALPRLLGLLDEFQIKATFFIIGRDTEAPAKAAAIGEVARRGHELANHSWSHRLGLEEAGDTELVGEIERTSAAIEALCGARPAGFRAPGYAAGPRVLAACARAGIRYDGSRLPTWAGPLLRFMAGRLRARVRREIVSRPLPPEAALDAPSGGRDLQTGDARQYGVSRPLPPEAALNVPSGGRDLQTGDARQYGGGGGLAPEWFRPPGGGAAVLRLPLAVSPVLRLPLHASLGQALGARFVAAGLRRLARRGAPVTWLLHGMDFLGAEDLEGRLPRALAQTAPFQVRLEAKMKFIRAVLGEFTRVVEVVRTGDWVCGCSLE